MRAVAIVLVAGCAFDPRGMPEPVEPIVTIIEDTAADFASARELVDITVTPRGTLEPHAFALGGLRARAFTGNSVTPSSTWTDVETAVALTARSGFAYGQLPTNWLDQRPLALGLRDPFDNFTLLFEGEIELAAGEHVLAVDADDTGIVEIDLGAGFANTTLDTAPTGAATTTLAVPAAGWYPIRAALGEDGGFARLVISLDGITLVPQQLRARITDDHGLVVKAFERGHVPPLGATAVDVVDSMFGQVPPPYDLPLTPTYDLRFVGQIFVDTAGTWTLAAKRLSTVDLMRLWIDGKRVASAYEDGFTEGLPEVATLDLAVGWHDIAVDLAAYQAIGGNANPHDVGIALTATPPGGVEAPVTSAMLRPVVAANLASAFISGVVPLTTDDVSTVTVTVPAIPGAVIDVTDVGYFLERANPADFTVELDTGTGSPIPIPSGDPGVLSQSVLFSGQPLPITPWTLRFTDTNIDGAPTDAFAFFAYVDFSCHGGDAMPFARMTSYTSSALETPGATRIAAIRVVASFGAATATIAVRTAPSEAALDAAVFVDVADGAAPAVTADRFVQYRITTTSDGWANPVVDTVEIDYAVAE